MCQFCHEHGEGKKWYLQAKNYSDDLLSDVRRRKFIAEFASSGVESLSKEFGGLKKLAKLPGLIRGLLARLVTWKMKKVHFGQVVPIEEIEQIFGFVKSIVRVSCICRRVSLGKEKRYCYGISLEPDGGEFGRIFSGVDKSYADGPHSPGLERLTREQALEAFRQHEKEGLCHTVWTFYTPFIAGICNCDRSDCLAMRSTVTNAVPVMFRAEWLARVDPEKCTGCRQCMRLCQFGALTFSAGSSKVAVDERRCYGCGICRSACAPGAIRLEDRRSDAVASGLW